MAEMGQGYGSECHLLRYLGRHRCLFDGEVLAVVGGERVEWLDYPFDSSRTWPDGEWKGLDFLPADRPARKAWRSTWPQRGNPPNWDAVGQITIGNHTEWLLVESKANVQEIGSSCQASPLGGRPLIEKLMEDTKRQLGVAPDRDWLSAYYQFCNRIAVLNFLLTHGVLAHLLFVYFTGDRGGLRRTCPADEAEWTLALAMQAAHVGLPSKHALTARVHKFFLATVHTDTPKGES